MPRRQLSPDEIARREEEMEHYLQNPRPLRPIIHSSDEEEESPTSPPASPPQPPYVQPRERPRSYPASPDFPTLAQRAPIRVPQSPDFPTLAQRAPMRAPPALSLDGDTNPNADANAQDDPYVVAVAAPPAPRQTAYGADPITGAQVGLSPPLVFPAPPLPPVHTQAIGIAASPRGARYGVMGRVLMHLNLPVVIQVIPEPDESWRFEPMSAEGLSEVEIRSRRVALRPLVAEGDIAFGWWADMGTLYTGWGKVVRVYLDVRMPLVRVRG
ncbi:hypothetical protein BDW74DRAFT_180376 [Aspergillus multicolor]|uniref:uncharacterized protein n=1 Tax=Aspergillus multicolor TaxID=41759 RepID=UPI003CCDF0D2